MLGYVEGTRNQLVCCSEVVKLVKNFVKTKNGQETYSFNT